MNPRDFDYTEAAELLTYLAGRIVGYLRRYRRRHVLHRCGRSPSTYRAGEAAYNQTRDLAWFAELPSFAPIPGEVLPAPVSPPMYPAVEAPRELVGAGAT